MSDNPFDAFSNIDLSEFENPSNTTSAPDPKKDEIEAAARSAGFSSRDPARNKERSTVKGATLFTSDIQIITDAQEEYRNLHPEKSIPSISDVIRTGLHVFKTLPIEEKAQLLTEHRGRGRK